MEFGIGSYTFPWETGIAGQPRLPLPLKPETLLRRAANWRVPVVQIADNMSLDQLGPDRLGQLADLASELDIRVQPGARGTAPRRLRTFIGICARFSSRILRVVPEADDSPEQILANVVTVVPDLQMNDVTLCIENYESLPVRDLARIVREAGDPHIRVCLDPVNSYGRGEGYAEVMDALADLTENLHIKDYSIRRSEHTLGYHIRGVPAGDGDLRIRDLTTRVPPGITGIVELWTPWQGTLESTVELEVQWAQQSVDYLSSLSRA